MRVAATTSGDTFTLFREEGPIASTSTAPPLPATAAVNAGSTDQIAQLLAALNNQSQLLSTLSARQGPF
jgi:hypothetical protein